MSLRIALGNSCDAHRAMQIRFGHVLLVASASLHRKRLAHDSCEEGEMWLRDVFD
jgi:hypothetical protein